MKSWVFEKSIRRIGWDKGRYLALMDCLGNTTKEMKKLNGSEFPLHAEVPTKRSTSKISTRPQPFGSDQECNSCTTGTSTQLPFTIQGSIIHCPDGLHITLWLFSLTLCLGVFYVLCESLHWLLQEPNGSGCRFAELLDTSVSSVNQALRAKHIRWDTPVRPEPPTDLLTSKLTF